MIANKLTLEQSQRLRAIFEILVMSQDPMRKQEIEALKKKYKKMQKEEMVISIMQEVGSGIADMVVPGLGELTKALSMFARKIGLPSPFQIARELKRTWDNVRTFFGWRKGRKKRKQRRREARLAAERRKAYLRGCYDKIAKLVSNFSALSPEERTFWVSKLGTTDGPKWLDYLAADDYKKHLPQLEIELIPAEFLIDSFPGSDVTFQPTNPYRELFFDKAVVY